MRAPHAAAGPWQRRSCDLQPCCLIRYAPACRVVKQALYGQLRTELACCGASAHGSALFPGQLVQRSCLAPADQSTDVPLRAHCVPAGPLPHAARPLPRRAGSAAGPPRTAGARRPLPAGPRATCARPPPQRAACPAGPPAACATAACRQLERQLAAAGERLQCAEGELDTQRDAAAAAQRAADGALATAAAARTQLAGHQVLSKTCLVAARAASGCPRQHWLAG